MGSRLHRPVLGRSTRQRRPLGLRARSQILHTLRHGLLALMFGCSSCRSELDQFRFRWRHALCLQGHEGSSPADSRPSTRCIGQCGRTKNLCRPCHEGISRSHRALSAQRSCLVLHPSFARCVQLGVRERRHSSPLDAKDHDPMWGGPQVHRRVNPASSLFPSHRRRLGGRCCAQVGYVEVICHLEPILQSISALHVTWPHNPCCWLSCTVHPDFAHSATG